ncbi:hypothetical protein BDY24DRAFT_368908 [Mrakia frigida]|uniref:uncharacterized protein n=1 Tax=Mrakia frigida TaxID=29902 RepID=UPI003FCC10C7
MLLFQLFIALVLLSLASAQISIEPFNEPPSLCTPIEISWTAGTPPFELKLFSDTRILSTLASLHVERSFSWTPLRVHPEESLYLTIYDGSRTTIGKSGRFGIRDDDQWEVVNETCRVVDQLERSVSLSEASAASIISNQESIHSRPSEPLRVGLLIFFALLGGLVLFGIPLCIWNRRRRARLMLQTKERLITYDEAVEFDLWGSGEVASRYGMSEVEIVPLFLADLCRPRSVAPLLWLVTEIVRSGTRLVSSLC